MKNINIHFVCRGNTYRSRLAQAYLNSAQNNNWNISSSGIDADKRGDVMVSPWAVITARQNNITESMSDVRTQTSSQMLQDNDIIVFMNQDVYQDAKKAYDFNESQCLVWHVKDKQDWPNKLPATTKRKGTFRQIKQRVDQLVHDVTAGSWVDIVDDHNGDLGFRLPITIANQKALWHRGCQVVITTPARNTIIQLRSKEILFAPNLIDITLGGHVDTGENPKHSAVREIKEEMGIAVDPSTLRLIDVHKWNRYHPHYKRHTKTFIYAYHVPIAEDNPKIDFQKEEVQAVRILSPVQLKRLIRLHHIANLGRLNYRYAYFSRLLKLIEQ